MRTRRFCHGRPDVSEKERRLLSRGETPGYGPGRGPESGGFTERYDAPPTRDGFGRKSFMIPLQSKLHADAWHEQLAMHKGQPGGDALLRVYAEKMSRGEPYPWIRTMGDAKLAEFKLIHGQNGTLVESGMTSAYASNTRENAEEERAWREGRGLEYTREKNARKAAGFRQRSAFDVSRAPTPENPANVAERERRGAAQEAMYARWTRAENLRKEMRRALYDATKEGGGDSYWGRLLRKFDAEMDKIVARQPSLTHGLQSNEQFDAWIAEHNAYLDPVESSLREWQSVLLQPVGTVNVLNEAEMGELLKHYDRTQVLFANYAQSRFVAEEVLQGDAPIEQKRSLVLKAVADLNAFGSHLYKYYAGQKVLPGQIDAYMQGVQRYLDANGKLKNGDLVTITAITADEAGIQELLKIRTELLSSLQVQAFEKDKRTLGDLEAHVVASRREVEYLERTNAKNERYEEVNDSIPNLSVVLAVEYKKATDAIDMADTDKKLAAANREYLFSKTHYPDDARTKELFNRSNDSPGIIQQALKAKHDTLPIESLAAVDVAATPQQIRTALANVRTEGRFLWRHSGELTPGLEQRAHELPTLQGRLVLKLANVLFAEAKGDVSKNADAIEAMAYEMKQLGNHAANADVLAALRKTVDAKAMELRGPVNEQILAVNKAKTFDIEAVNSLLRSILAERGSLALLGIGQDRVGYLDKELAIYEEMTKKTDAAVDAELQPKKKGEVTPIDAFKKANQLLTTEEAMIRKTFERTPEFIAPRLAAIKARRDKLLPMISASAKAAVDQLDPKTATREQVAKATGLLDAELEAKGGNAMSDPKELMRLDALRTKIAEADAAVKAREEAQAKALAEKNAKELAAKREAEAKAAKEKAAKEKAEADKLAAEKAAKEQAEKAAEKTKDEQPLKDADAILAWAEQPVAEKSPAKKVEELNKRIDLLFDTDATLHGWQEAFKEQGKDEYVSRIDRWSEKRAALSDALRLDLEKTLVGIGDKESLRKASTLFEVRYMEFLLREAHDAKPNEEERVALLKDLDETPQCLLPKAIETSVGQKVIEKLLSMKTKLEQPYELRHSIA